MIVAAPIQRADRSAHERGLRRDGVRLVVVDRAARSVSHVRFSALADLLRAGDLLVVNSSRTLPAAIAATRSDGERIQLRPAVRRGRRWDALAVGPRPPHANVPLRPGETLNLDGGVEAVVLRPRADVPLLWRLELNGDGLAALLAHGQPIRYSYVPSPVPADRYQTVYATHPGSAEAPSAGLPLTWELLGELRDHGVGMTDIVLHAGLSSFQDDDVDAEHHLVEERFIVSAETAGAVNDATGRTIAVGTTVVRALESAVSDDGIVEKRDGWTRLAVAPRTQLHAVDALLTGMHESSASHMAILRAVARDDDLLERAFGEAADLGYLWHEFGDSMLIV